MFILFISFFGNEDCSLTLPLSLSFSLPLDFSVSVPSILWCSVSQPTTHNEIFRRMVTKSNCFIWMMHLGIFVLFENSNYKFYLCLFSVSMLQFSPCFFPFTPLFFFCFVLGCFWFSIWTGSLSLLLTCIPYLYLSHLRPVCVWCGSATIVLIGRNAASDACWLAEFFLKFIYFYLLLTLSHVMRL